MSSPRLPRRLRWAAVFCIGAFFATMWPIYPLFSGIEPFVLGMPLSLFYLVAVIGVVFSVMLALFLWEERNDELD